MRLAERRAEAARTQPLDHGSASVAMDASLPHPYHYLIYRGSEGMTEANTLVAQFCFSSSMTHRRDL